MPTPDFFGVSDRVKQMTAPAGYAAIHQDGFSWARPGGNWHDSTRVGPADWNQILANLRALLTAPGVVFNDTDPRSPYLLRDVIVSYTGHKIVELLPSQVTAAVAAGLPGDLHAASTTSVAIGTGAKSFAVTGGGGIFPGARVVASSNANPTTHRMDGVVTANAAGTLEMTADYALGSGSRADWTISLTGEIGPAIGGLLTTRGDVVRRGAAAAERLALGAAGSMFGSDGTDAVWRTPSQARADIGANVASNLTSGTIPDARLPARLVQPSATLTDFNTIPTDFGLVFLSAASNGPNAASHFAMHLGTASFAMQLSFDVSTSGGYYARSKVSGTFGSWDRLLSSANAAAVLPASTTAAGVIEIATAAEYRTGTDTTRALGVAEVWAAAALATLTDAATIAVSFAAGINFGGAANAVLALGGNRELGAPTNLKHQSGVLWFGAATSTRTLTLNAAWLLCDGVEAGPYSILTTQELGVAYTVRASRVYVTGILRRLA